MRKPATIFLSLILLSSAVSAQKVSGTVTDQQNKGLDKTTVSLLRSMDSSVVKLSVTDKDGNYSIPVSEGSYLVSVSHIGYDPLYSKQFTVSGTGSVTVETLSMAKTEKAMQAVVVTSQKPMVEVKADKTILNVEGTINATGSDALELLRKSPGVMVYKDDNLSVAGKTGVQVFIDGKPSPLTGQDLSNYLKTLQSAQIEAIEIITNPSAKYEAAGNAGIINIRLKKNKTFGTNGSVNAGYNIGVYPKYNGGFALNHRNKHMNIFGNYNYNDNKSWNEFNYTKTQFDTLFEQSNTLVSKSQTHGFKAGVDFFLNQKSTIGAMVNGNLADVKSTTEGPMYITYMPTNQLDRVLIASNHSDGVRNNVNANINYRYSVRGGTELKLDADYGYYKIRWNQLQPNVYEDANGNELNSYTYNMIAPSDIDLYSVKADYERNFKGGRLGIGGKIGYVNTDNDFQRYDVYGGNKVLDTLKSNLFEYRENINALYVNYNKGYKGFMIQLGLRMENTHSEGESTGFKDQGGTLVPYDSSFKRDYTDFFPSAAITFNKNPMSQWSFTYSRRIDRPAYQDLNPFEFKLNEYTFTKGNTQLRPQYTNSIGVTHSYKYKLNTTLNYSHVKDIFAQIPDTTEKTKTFLTKKNLATSDVVSLNMSYPFQYKWYSFFANVNAAYSYFKADYGDKNNPNDDDLKIDQGAFSFMFYMQNSFKLGKCWTGELSGFYMLPGLWQGVFKSTSIYGVDGGVQKSLFNNKANMRIVLSDMFNLMKWSGTSNYAGARNEANGKWESRQLKVSFSYRFGNTQVKQARQRKTGIDEESKRTTEQGNTPVGQ